MRVLTEGLKAYLKACAMSAQQARMEKAAKAKAKRIVSEVEEYLGTKGAALEGEKRDDLMLLVYSLYLQLSEQEEEITASQGELDRLMQDMNVLEERAALQEKLIKVYQNLVGSQDDAAAVLKEQIVELSARLEQLEKKPRSRKPEDLSLEEQQKALEKKIERSQKRQEKLQRQLTALLAEDCLEEKASKPDVLSGGDGFPIPSEETEDPKETDLVLEPEAETPGQGQPTEEQAPDQETEEPIQKQETEEPVQEQGTNGQEGGEGPAPGDTSEDHGNDDPEAEAKLLRERVKELEQQLEETNYQAHMDSSNSNVPPRMKGYSDAKPYQGIGGGAPQDGGKTDAGTDGGNPTGENEKGEGDQEEDPIAALEAAAEKAALHDPHKSPDAKRTGRRGKRKGSSGGGRTWPDADRYQEVKCFPTKCNTCPHRETCEGLQNAKKFDRPHATYDIEITRVITYHQPMQCQCPLGEGETLIGPYPEGATNWFRYGNGIRALAVVLNTVGMVSYERIADILRGLIDDEKLSAGTVNRWVSETAEKLHPTVRYIKAGIFSGEYLHSDESGVHVRGSLHWVHTACNMAFVYMRVDRQRGEAAMKRIGILPEYMGTLITDCWASYWGMGGKHGLCIAHLLRELLALVKYFSRDAEWAQEMMDLLNEMNEERKKLIAKEKTEFDKDVLEDFYKRYDQIVEKGLKVHPDSEAKKSKRGKAKKYRGRNLLDRLKERKENFLQFLVDFDCPFTNNQAEKSLRLFAIKRSVVGSFDTYEGADDFAVIWSYIATAKRRERNSYEAIHAALEGEATSFMFEEEEIRELDEVLEHLDQKNLEQFLKDKEDDEKQLEEAREKAAKKKERADERQQAALEKARAATAAEAEAREARCKADQLKPLGGNAAADAEAKASQAEKKAQDMQEKAENARRTALSTREKARKEQAKVDALAAQVAWNIRAAAYFLEIPEEYWQEEIPA